MKNAFTVAAIAVALSAPITAAIITRQPSEPPKSERNGHDKFLTVREFDRSQSEVLRRLTRIEDMITNQ